MLIEQINKVTLEELDAVGKKYLAPLFDPSKCKTVIICDPKRLDEIKTGFGK